MRPHPEGGREGAWPVCSIQTCPSLICSADRWALSCVLRHSACPQNAQTFRKTVKNNQVDSAQNQHRERHPGSHRSAGEVRRELSGLTRMGLIPSHPTRLPLISVSGILSPPPPHSAYMEWGGMTQVSILANETCPSRWKSLE